MLLLLVYLPETAYTIAAAVLCIAQQQKAFNFTKNRQFTNAIVCMYAVCLHVAVH